MIALRIIVGIAVTIAATWVLLLVAVTVLRPRGMNLADAKRFVPDVIRLLKALASDNTLPRGVRRRLALLLAYLALPIDLVPDFLPVIGYADDVILVAVVLRSVIRAAGPTALDRHWSGNPAGLAVVRRLAGIRI